METNYIQVNSDHPPSIIKEIPRSIEKRLSILSSSENISSGVSYYQELSGVISGLYFPVFGLNTEIYGINPRIQSVRIQEITDQK